MDAGLKEVFQQSSSITFIAGKRDSGKTAFGLLLLQVGLSEGLFSQVASNITMREPSGVAYICYYDDLETWLQVPGKKAFILDELGVHLNRMAFMSKKSQLILKTCQLIRKYDAHLIGIAPNEDFINRHFLNRDILDMYIKKLSRKTCVIKNYVTQNTYTITDIPNTSYPFRSKDIALFEEANPNPKPELEGEMPYDQKLLLLYAKYHSLRAVGKILGIHHATVAYQLKKVIAKSELRHMLHV